MQTAGFLMGDLGAALAEVFVEVDDMMQQPTAAAELLALRDGSLGALALLLWLVPLCAMTLTCLHYFAMHRIAVNSRRPPGHDQPEDQQVATGCLTAQHS